MCPVISGIMMIDQRRAHERVLYEKYLASLGDGPVPAQVSLFPVETELNPGDIVILEEIKEEIKTLGFEVESGDGQHGDNHRSPGRQPQCESPGDA